MKYLEKNEAQNGTYLLFDAVTICNTFSHILEQRLSLRDIETCSSFLPIPNFQETNLKIIIAMFFDVCGGRFLE